VFLKDAIIVLVIAGYKQIYQACVDFICA